MVIAVGKKWSHHSPIKHMHCFSWAWFISQVCCIKFPPRVFYLIFRSVHALSEFLLYIFPIVSNWQCGIKDLCSCGYTDICCPVIGVSSSKRPKRVGAPPPIWGGKHPVSKIVFSSFLKYRAMNKVQKPSKHELVLLWFCPTELSFTCTHPFIAVLKNRMLSGSHVCLILKWISMMLWKITGYRMKWLSNICMFNLTTQ